MRIFFIFGLKFWYYQIAINESIAFDLLKTKE